MHFGYADDGMCTCDVHGRLIRVFRPRWWELRRWFGWVISKHRLVTEIAWIVPIAPASQRSVLYRSNGKIVVRAFLLEPK